MLRLTLGLVLGASIAGAAGYATEGFQRAPDADTLSLAQDPAATRTPRPTRTPQPTRTPRPTANPTDVAWRAAQYREATWAAAANSTASVQTMVATIRERLKRNITNEGGGCDSNYSGACIPESIYDLDCGDIYETDFYVEGYDVHGFDGDDDGVGCESY